MKTIKAISIVCIAALFLPLAMQAQRGGGGQGQGNRCIQANTCTSAQCPKHQRLHNRSCVQARNCNADCPQNCNRHCVQNCPAAGQRVRGR
ncbi:MAG: hypothetical protein ACPF9Q_03605 [Opitutales bacterium]